MKAVFLTPLLIAALIGGLGWYYTGRLTEVREHHRQIALEAAHLGIGLDPTETGKIRVTKKPRDVKPATTGLPVADMIAFMKQTEDARIQKLPLSPDSREKIELMVDQVKQMRLPQLRGMIADIMACEDLSIEARSGWATKFIDAIRLEHPADAVELYLNVPAPNGSRSFAAALGTWVTADRENALTWVRQHMTDRPDLLDSAAKRTVIHSIAVQDRRVAFRMIGELDVDDPSYAPQGIVASAKTAEERIDAIAALREYLPTVESTSDRYRAGDYAIAALGRSMVTEGFESASKWAESAAMTPEELSSFGSDLGISVIKGEARQWAEWFARKLPGPGCVRPVRQIVRYWAMKDYVDAGNWLAAAPAGDMKNGAASVYAEVVVDKEPEVAAQWADTLPSGMLRTQTLERVYRSWPKKDDASKAAANEFARRHGLK